MEVIKDFFVNVRDYLCMVALFLYLIPLALVCKVCGIQLDD